MEYAAECGVRLDLHPPSVPGRGNEVVRFYGLVSGQRRSLGYVNDGTKKDPRWREVTTLDLAVVAALLDGHPDPLEAIDILLTLDDAARGGRRAEQSLDDDSKPAGLIRSRLRALGAAPDDGWIP